MFTECVANVCGAQCLTDLATSNSGADLVLVDTAGRLHTAYALMEELTAVKQVRAGAT